MKTLFQQASRFLLLTAFAAGSLASTARAQTAPAKSVYVDQVSECVYQVRVSNPGQRLSKVQLVRKADGALLYEASSAEPSFGQRINVGSLRDGQYALVVKTGRETYRFPLNLRTTAQRTSLLSLATPATN